MRHIIAGAFSQVAYYRTAFSGAIPSQNRVFQAISRESYFTMSTGTFVLCSTE